MNITSTIDVIEVIFTIIGVASLGFAAWQAYDSIFDVVETHSDSMRYTDIDRYVANEALWNSLLHIMFAFGFVGLGALAMTRPPSPVSYADINARLMSVVLFFLVELFFLGHSIISRRARQNLIGSRN